MICTDQYVKKANSGVGGVGYEKMIITSDLIKNIDSNKFIPIIRQKGTHNVPTFLKTKLFIDFSLDDNYEFSYDELIRTLHNSPLYVKPKIGNNPFKEIKDIQPDKTNDALKELMTIIIEDFEKGHNYSLYKDIVVSIGISRIMLDDLIQKAIKLELIGLDSGGDVVLRKKGKFYAIEHKIVKV